MEDNYQSEWSKSIPLREQKQIIKRLLHFAKPFKATFIIAILFALGLSVINVLLPRIIQTFMDEYLAKQSATTQVILFLQACIYLGSSSKVSSGFSNGICIPMLRLKPINISV